MEHYEEAVSPMGQCLESTYMSVYILAVLEFEVRDEEGVKRWKKVEVKLEEHMIEATYVDGMSLDSYDKQFSEYLSTITIEKLPQTKPLWEVHVIKYPTSTAQGTLIFKFHHSIGDGYTLMGLLLSYLQRAHDPSLPLSFPSRKSSKQENTSSKFFLFRIPKLLSMTFNYVSDFAWSFLKSTLLEDDKTLIRSGVEAVGSLPTIITDITFSIDHIKEIKSNLGVIRLTINDVITGIIFYGLRLFMQDVDSRSSTLKSTAFIVANTRNAKDYQCVQDMLKTNAKGAWGNHFTDLLVSMPILKDTSISNPLLFVKKAHNSIKNKRYSFATLLTSKLLLIKNKFQGSEAMAKHFHKTCTNSSFMITNMIGPLEQMSLGNHPIRGFFFTLCGIPQSLVITIMSYMGLLRVTTITKKGFIDEQKLMRYLNNAYEIIRQEEAKENVPK